MFACWQTCENFNIVSKKSQQRNGQKSTFFALPREMIFVYLTGAPTQNSKLKTNLAAQIYSPVDFQIPVFFCSDAAISSIRKSSIDNNKLRIPLFHAKASRHRLRCAISSLTETCPDHFSSTASSSARILSIFFCFNSSRSRIRFMRKWNRHLFAAAGV